MQSPEGNLSQGKYFNELTVSMPYKGRLFAEQDLVYGWHSLSQLIASSPAPFILSNVRLAANALPKGGRSKLLTEVGDYKIGVITFYSAQAKHILPHRVHMFEKQRLQLSNPQRYLLSTSL